MRLRDERALRPAMPDPTPYVEANALLALDGTAEGEDRAREKLTDMLPGELDSLRYQADRLSQLVRDEMKGRGRRG